MSYEFFVTGYRRHSLMSPAKYATNNLFSLALVFKKTAQALSARAESFNKLNRIIQQQIFLQTELSLK
jgi:hypothetical protein